MSNQNKILIIALPRTGSTSLLDKISNEKNLTPLFEPFDKTGRVLYNGQSNVVVKTIINQHPNNFELSKEFGEIILLSRKNLKEHIESHSYRIYFSKKKGYKSNQKYVYTEPPQYIIDDCTNDINRWNDELIKLSHSLNIPITYYEDLFDKNSKEKLRVEIKDKKELI